MMGTRAPLIGGDEWDALTRRGKRVLRWQPGVRQWCKAKFWRRVRKQARLAIKQEDAA